MSIKKFFPSIKSIEHDEWISISDSRPLYASMIQYKDKDGKIHMDRYYPKLQLKIKKFKYIN